MSQSLHVLFDDLKLEACDGHGEITTRTIESGIITPGDKVIYPGNNPTTPS